MSDCDCEHEEEDEEEDSEEKKYEVSAGAGWLMAEVEAEDPEEAYEIWERMWDKMLEDVSDLSEREREQAGLTR